MPDEVPPEPVGSHAASRAHMATARSILGNFLQLLSEPEEGMRALE